MLTRYVLIAVCGVLLAGCATRGAASRALAPKREEAGAAAGAPIGVETRGSVRIRGNYYSR